MLYFESIGFRLARARLLRKSKQWDPYSKADRRVIALESFIELLVIVELRQQCVLADEINRGPLLLTFAFRLQLRRKHLLICNLHADVVLHRGIGSVAVETL